MTAPASTDHRRENALLLAAARAAAPTDAQRDALPSVDWPYLLAAADRQGVSPLLAQWLETHTLVAPPAAARTLHTARWSNHFRNAALLRELAHLRDAAAAHGIPLLPLKGAALSPDYYPAPALRPMSDLDLCAPVGEFGRVPVFFVAQGYAQTPPGATDLVPPRLRQPWQRELQFSAVRGGVSVLVEVRAEPLDPAPTPIAELDAALAARLRAYAGRLWGRATAADSAPRIAPEDLALHVASHMVTRHADFRLLWLHDLARVLEHTPAFDWELLAHEAHALGLAGPVRAAFGAATRWLAAPAAPAGVWRERRSFAPVARLADAAEGHALARRAEAVARADLSAPQPAPFWPTAAALTRMRGLRPRLRVLRWLLFPSGSYLAQVRGLSGEVRGGRYARAALARLGASAITAGRVVAGGVRARLLRP